jgi:hypothetical protein
MGNEEDTSVTILDVVQSEMLVGDELPISLRHSTINSGKTSLSLFCQSGIALSCSFTSLLSLKQIGLGSKAFSPSGSQQYSLFFRKVIFV